MRPLLILSAFALAACQPDNASGPETAPPTGQASPTLEEPMAEKRPVELTQHGHTRIDEYFWLRDDERKDPEVLAYLEQENAWFDQEMAHTAKLQETLFEEMTGRLDPDESSVPYEWNGYWYYSRFEDGKEYAIYARKAGSLDAEEEVLVDGDRWEVIRRRETMDDLLAMERGTSM